MPNLSNVDALPSDWRTNMSATHERIMNQILQDNRYMLKEALGRVDRLLVAISHDASANYINAEFRQKHVNKELCDIFSELEKERN